MSYTIGKENKKGCKLEIAWFPRTHSSLERCQVSKHCLKVARNKFQSVTNCSQFSCFQCFHLWFHFKPLLKSYKKILGFQGKFPKTLGGWNFMRKVWLPSLQIVAADHHNGTLLTQNCRNLKERWTLEKYVGSDCFPCQLSSKDPGMIWTPQNVMKYVQGLTFRFWH